MVAASLCVNVRHVSAASALCTKYLWIVVSVANEAIKLRIFHS